ncbi:hypothetical protein DQ384_11750 [Sphaerisporangium album]|uniref:Uncharacterized protein n=1 Tax=Sphaerisporangium album TaxID=509200 RepID=A0A367FM82_9ACTN|nr:hypothetical protein [Sphaerisporangium album]RCG31374.1 hypothetical protein DQ384_11750 [Sphaerisporangium album]
MTTVSAVVASLGLTGAVLLAAAPLTSNRANAAQLALAEPTQVVEPTDPTITDLPDPSSPEPEPTVTVTITESPDPTVTKTRTVTPKPTKSPTKPPKATPSASKTSPIAPPPTTETLPSAPTIPTNPPLLETTPPPVETPAPDPQVSLSLVSPPPPTASPTDTTNLAFEDPTPDSVPIEIRNASPEYDQLTLSRKLAIPGVLLAVLVMLGVLIFEGRIRRMAHAAAIRRAGPRAPGRHRGGDFFGYPVPPYPIYHGGTTYAPVVSFVPVHGYPSSPLPGYEDPYGVYGQGDPMAPGQTAPQAGPSVAWPPVQDVPAAPQPGAGDATVTMPAPGGQMPPTASAPRSGVVLPGQFPGEEKRTLQGPLPDGKQGRGLLGRFWRGRS